MTTATILNNEVLLASIETSNIAHCITAPDGDNPIIYVNQAFLDEIGYTRDEVIGRNCRFLQGPLTDTESVELIRGALRGEQPINIDLLNYRRDGSSFWNNLSISPTFDHNGNLIAYIAVQSNVSHIIERQRVEADRNKLESLGQVSANINHEIKNLLQPISLMAGMLDEAFTDDELDKEKALRYINTIHEHVKLAKNLSGRILDYSKNDVGELSIFPVSTVSDLIHEFTASFIPSNVLFEYKTQALALSSKKQAYLSISMQGLQQVCLNLINNALKVLHGQGCVSIEWSYEVLKSSEAEKLYLSPDVEYLKISFKDSGPGIPTNHLQHIFEPFYTTHSPGSGAGLGLSISSNIVKSWQGTITANNLEKDGGACFDVYIPLKK